MKRTITQRITAALASSRGLFLSAVIAGSLSGLGFLGIGESSHTVTAQFRDADGLVVGNEVRVAGVAAGSVTSVLIEVNQSTGKQFAQVDMTIDSSQWPLHQGTRVAVKPKGVLSNVFVELDPGSVHSPPLGDHPFFPLDKTQSPVSLDELSNVFTESVRNSIRTQLQEGVLAFGGSGTVDLNQTLANANPLTADAVPVLDVLAMRSPELDRLNFEFDTVSGELAREDANLRPLIVNLNTTLNALVVRETDLQGTLDHAAAVFGDLDQALSSPATQDALARIFREGPQALSCAQAISTYITPIIDSVNPYIHFGAGGDSRISLDGLLADFVTATGFNLVMQSGVVPSSGNALRANPFVPDTVDPHTGQPIPPSDTGGLSLNHKGYLNAQIPNGHGGTVPAYVQQPPLSGYPTLNGCTPPAGLPS